MTINSVVYGTLTLNADGTFSFRARENLGADYPVRLKLSLEAADADGDVEGTRDTPVTFVISKPAGPAP